MFSAGLILAVLAALCYGAPEGSIYSTPLGVGTGNWSDAYSKARAFVCDLTLTEKVNLTTQTGTGATYSYQLGIIPRIGFRGLALDDSPTGVRGTDYNSGFAAGLNLAMTWDRELIYQQSFANGAEHKAKGVHITYAPVAGPLGRAPAAGRNWEGYSPDPYLSGIAFGQSIAGMQAGGTIAVGKHFVLYEQEHYRQYIESNDYGYAPYNVTEPYSSNADDRTLHELYLYPWYDAVEAGMAGLMCSYNQLNNTQACQNNHLLNDILKGEMGYQGFIVSDDGSQHDGVLTALAGMDMTILGETSPNGIEGFGISFWGPNLTTAVLNGSIPEWRLDDMATRIMASYFYLGQDQDFPELNFAQGNLNTYGYLYPHAEVGFQQINQHVDVREDHAKIIRTVGAESNVLLKNVNNTLPLNSTRQIGIFGSDAGPLPLGPNGCSDKGCDNGTLAMAWGSGTAGFPYLVDPLQAIQTRALQDGTEVQYVLDNFAYNQIDSVATQATTCMTFVNADSGEGYIQIDGNYGDRNNLTAWLGGDELITRVAANCSNTIVVMHGPGPILVEDWIDNPNVTAVIFAGLPGQESGNSLVDVVFGDVNPSGRLPWTLGKRREDYGTDVLYEPNGVVPQINFTEGLYIDYRFFDQNNIEPRYPFGYGLSYTTFDYSNLRIENLASDGATSPAPSPTATPAPTSTANFQCPATAAPTDPASYVFPSSISSIRDYIYPYINASDASTITFASPAYPAPSATITTQAAEPQGGDPSLYDVLYRVSVSVSNTGGVAGKAIPQLYLDLGNDSPSRQLRGFNKTALIQPGQSIDVTMDLRKRDISIWDVVSQKWTDVTTLGTNIGVFVGPDSRDLPLTDQIAAVA